jgi:2-succinyl-5-enolpyruvyl-6-hydroxy-3-cyclohexene-1-carboxylate synthase
MTDRATRMYALCARFFVELRALGVEHAVIAPGSRSAPLAIGAKAAGLSCAVHLDERVAGFHALGYAKVAGVPAVVVCSSGTAGANLLPAVVESHHAQVPLIVCTADRPPELRGWGAGQTIDQISLFGTSPRWRYELPVAGEVDEWLGRSVALRAYGESTGPVAGPVHLNWPFREPLEPPDVLPRPSPTVAADSVEAPAPGDGEVLERLARTYERGLVVVGPGERTEAECAAILDFAAAHGWPVVADPCSQIRNCGRGGPAPIVTTGELLFSAASFVADLGTEVVVRVGLAPTSKAYRLWLESHRPETLVLVGAGIEWADPTHEFDHVVTGPVADAFAGAVGRGRTEWTERWLVAESVAMAEVASVTAAEAGELAVAAIVADAMPDGSTLVVSSSMPVRDLDIVLRADARRIRVVCNRGANGIDGVVATALGAATASEGPTVLLIGDVAAVHDVSGIVAMGRLAPDVTTVVVDNDGGGIFSFLPMAAHGERVWFTELFSTPHGTDLVAIAAGAGVRARQVEVGDLREALAAEIEASGPALMTVRTDAGDHVAAFAGLRGAVDEALDGTWS